LEYRDFFDQDDREYASPTSTSRVAYKPRERASTSRYRPSQGAFPVRKSDDNVGVGMNFSHALMAAKSCGIHRVLTRSQALQVYFSDSYRLWTHDDAGT